MATLAFIPNIGPLELVVVLVIALLIFGRRLPEVGRSLGRGIVEFRKGLHGIEREIDEASRPEQLPPSSAKPEQQAGRSPITEEAVEGPRGRIAHSPPQPGAQS
jgi:sec-independent protein translocase protein TatA